MMKKFLCIFITVFITFFDINVVKAENCASIEEKITLYDTYTNALEKLDCNDSSNSENVITCNNYNTNRNMIIIDLMKQNEQNNICSNQKKEVEKIIKENKSRCGKIFDDDFSNFVNKFMTIFYILGPILLIFFGSLDYAKAVVSSDAESMKKANKNFARRLAATILLFLSPAIVNIIIGINVTDKYLSGNAYSCDFDYLVYTKKYSIKYVPRKKSSNKKNSTIVVGGITTDAEADALEKELTDLLNTKIHTGGSYQNGPFPKWWANRGLDPFQCTWWANGRASQYLEEHGTIYRDYPTRWGDGGEYYDMNKNNGWFEYGSQPRPNSVVSWSIPGGYGHVAYVEGVSANYIYISEAGSGTDWYGISKIPITGEYGGRFILNGYIYLDEPIEKK